MTKISCVPAKQSLNENRIIVGCFCLVIMFCLSVFEEVITLRCSVKKFTVSLKHTTIIYISISTLVTPELQIFVFAIKFKYFKNSLFYYYYPNFFNMTFNLCFFLNYFLVRRYLLRRGVHHRLIKT